MSNKNIRLVLIVAIISGLLIEVVSFLSGNGGLLPGQIIGALFPRLNFSLLTAHSNILTYESFESGVEIRFVNIILFSLTMIGLSVWKNSKGEKVKLLRFALSVLLFGSFLNLVSLLIGPVTFLSYLFNSMSGVAKWSFWIISVLSHSVWVYLFYGILNTLSTGKNTETTPVSKQSRVYHLVLDSLLSLFMCSYIVIQITRGFLASLSDAIPEILMGYLLIIIGRIIYFTFFETIFGLTPTKLLTGSKVVLITGERLDFQKVLLRSLARHIPFNTFSYLKKGDGWHDQISGTRVVKEQ